MKKSCFFIIVLLCSFLGELSAQNRKIYSLNDLIETGLKTNPSLAASRSAVSARKADYEASKRLSNPSIELHAGKAESYDGFERINTRGISVSQYVENPLKRSYRVKAAEKEWRASEQSYELTKAEVIYQINEYVFKILLFEKSAELAEKNSGSIQEIFGLIKKRAELGEVKELEAIKLEVETLKAKNRLNRAKTNLRLARENLNKYLGNVLPLDFVVSGELSYRPVDRSEVELVETALSRHPAIRRERLKVEQAESLLNYTRWERFPDFTLSGFTEKELDGNNSGFGITFEIPLWDFKGKAVDREEFRVIQQQNQLKALQIAVSSEVRRSFGTLNLTEESIKIYSSRLLGQAEQSLNISEVSYKEGEISLIDYLDAQRTYFSILDDYYQVLYDWNREYAALVRAIGGELDV